MSVEREQSADAGADAYEETVAAVTLPDPVLDAVEAYEAVGGERDRFVWKWIYDLFPAFTLSSVPAEHADRVRTTKTLFTVFITLLDDVAERDGDARTFDRIRRAVRCRVDAGGDRDVGGGAAEDGDDGGDGDGRAAVVEFAVDLWATVERRLATAPRYDEFADVFGYDLRQALNAMEYSRVVNDHLAIANLGGATHYDSHNMVMFPYADVDVMHSPGFDPAEFGAVRELIWDLQEMARIGNWLTTWEREVAEGDYSAGVVVYALRNGIVTREELAAAADGDTAAVDRIHAHDVEGVFLADWHSLNRSVRERRFETDSVDLDAFVAGMETVMDHHLASEGYK
ncbi:hypothetical protein [Halobaculum lipolyticum]|uniref:Uncharacterized protein n=1 Tax=Halobaculum lipolyticum TaxID=3032001 RepID=A0ABD5WE23_9EURY|nr:hypothetical protein [Halobaculum sp. DT31]